MRNKMRKVIAGKAYDCESSSLLAHDQYWDGYDYERQGRNKFLYKTKKGNYFVLITSFYAGELDTITPISKTLAKTEYDRLARQLVSWDKAFDEEIEEA